MMTLLDRTEAFVREVAGQDLPEETVEALARKIIGNFKGVDGFGAEADDLLCPACGRSRSWPNVGCEEVLHYALNLT